MNHLLNTHIFNNKHLTLMVVRPTEILVIITITLVIIITREAVGTDLQTVVSVKVKDIQKVILQ